MFAFYINGLYYHLSKRLTKVRYATIRNKSTNYIQNDEENTIKTTFQVLAGLSFSTLCMQALADFSKYNNQPVSDEEIETSSSHPNAILKSQEWKAQKSFGINIVENHRSFHWAHWWNRYCFHHIVLKYPHLFENISYLIKDIEKISNLL